MGSKPATRLEALLDELCAGYGYCLPPDRKADLLAQPPQDVDAFVDAVLQAEGLDPSLCDERTRLDLSDVVRAWLFDERRREGNEVRAAAGDVGPGNVGVGGSYSLEIEGEVEKHLRVEV